MEILYIVIRVYVSLCVCVFVKKKKYVGKHRKVNTEFIGI